MDKELQNKAWAALPNEFKEEVKETYLEYSKLIAISDKNTDRYKGYLGAQTELELLFGENNLTDENHSKVEKIGKDCEEKQAEMPDTSQKDVISNVRLQVATAAMQGILVNDHLFKSVIETHFKASGSRDIFVASAIAARMCADALLAECGMCHKD